MTQRLVDRLGEVVPTSLPLHVRRLGSGDHAFVLLHGYAGWSFTWRHWLPALAQRGRVFSVDLKGFGEAPKPPDGRYTPSDLAELVTDFIVERDLQRVTLFGHSFGGGIGLLTALRFHDRGEDRVRRLVLIASTAYPQPLPPLVPLSKLPRLTALLLHGIGTRRAVRWVMKSIVHDPSAVTDEQVVAYARPLQSREGLAAVMAVGRQIVPPDLEAITHRYRELDMPVLLLWGSKDRVIPRWVGARLNADLPASRFVVLGDCGHVPPEELPEASWREVESFLNETTEAG